MKSQWFIWTLVAAVGIFILVIFNYQGKQDSVSLSHIFPDQDETVSPNIEYEFVDEGRKESAPVKAQVDAQLVQPTASVQAQVQPQTFAQVQPGIAASTKPAVTVSVQPIVQANPLSTVAKPKNIFSPSTASSSPSSVAGAGTKASKVVKGTKTFAIQIASYSDQRTAEIALKGVQAAGHEAYIVTKDLGTKGTWYRIYIGKYDSKDAANQKLSEVKANYGNSFIIAP